MNLEPGFLYFLPAGRKNPENLLKVSELKRKQRHVTRANPTRRLFGKKWFDNVTQTPKRQTLYSFFISIRRKSLISLATTCDTLHDKKKYDFLLDEKKNLIQTYTLPGMVQQLW